jgi:hypothetical protein
VINQARLLLLIPVGTVSIVVLDHTQIEATMWVKA